MACGDLPGEQRLQRRHDLDTDPLARSGTDLAAGRARLHHMRRHGRRTGWRGSIRMVRDLCACTPDFVSLNGDQRWRVKCT
jgi:hypothetical protein